MYMYYGKLFIFALKDYEDNEIFFFGIRVKDFHEDELFCKIEFWDRIV